MIIISWRGKTEAYQYQIAPGDIDTAAAWLDDAAFASTMELWTDDYIAGWHVVHGDLLLDTLPALSQLQQMARDLVEHDAETALVEIVSPGSGRILVLVAKQLEMNRYLQDWDPDIDRYPLIQCEMDALGLTATEVLARWQAIHDQWTSLAAPIEKRRLQRMAAIDTALRPADVLAVIDS
jgi:hypothetical protein